MKRTLLDRTVVFNNLANEVAEMLLSDTDNIAVCVKSILGLIGKSTGFDVVCVMENRGEESDLSYFIRHDWVSENSTCHRNLADENQIFQYLELPNWQERLSYGIHIYQQGSDETDESTSYPINVIPSSVLALPIHINELFWGFIYLASTLSPVVLKLEEIREIRKYSSIIGTAMLLDNLSKENSILKKNTLNSFKMRHTWLSQLNHEIRTSLNAIIAFSDTAQRQSDKAPYYLGQINTSAIGLLEKSSDLITQFHDEKLDTCHCMELVNIQEIFNEVIRSTDELFRQRRQTVRSMVEISQPEIYVSDKNLLLLALQLLLKFVSRQSENGGEIVINANEVSAQNGILSVNFYVSLPDACDYDIDLDTLGIFEPFSDTTLCVLDGLMTSLSGTITHCAGKPKCTGLILTVPFGYKVSGVAQTHNTISDKAEQDISAPNLVGKRILVVDDNEINQIVLSMLLEETGATIVVAENGQVACDLIRNSNDKFDLIFMDVNMPVMNGIEAAQMIRTFPNYGKNDVAIIAVTANTFEEDMENCKTVEMNAHLPKPVTASELYKTISLFT